MLKITSTTETLPNYKNYKKPYLIALFTVNFSHLHYNVIQRGCESISG